VPGPAYVSDPTILYLHQLLDELAKGYLQIPQFQRRFVWTDEQRLELLLSIRDGVSIGSILVWRTNLTTLKVVPRIGPHSLPDPAPSPTTARSYLLDGLQRLSTLYGCLRPLPASASAFTQDDDGNEVSWRVGYDLEAEQFAILDREVQPAPTWLPLTLLFDSIRLLQFQRGLASQPDADQLIQRADALAETFRSYKLPVIPVVTDDLASATRTFERINRPGTPMSELHMVRALTWTPDFDLEERLLGVRDRLAEVGWSSLEPELILKVCKAAIGVDINVDSPDESSKRLTANPSVIDDATNSLLRTAAWLGERCDVLSPKIVPYRMQIVLLAEVMRLCPMLHPVTSHRLHQWFWYTTYKQDASVFYGSQTNAMMEMLRRVASGNPLEIKERPIAPRLALPARDNPTWVYKKIVALQLAAMKPLDLDGTAIDASRQLASDGPNALVSIEPDLKEVTSRIFTRPQSDLRSRLLEAAPDMSREVLDSHAITPFAAQMLVTGKLSRFAAVRAAEIVRREQEFLDVLFSDELSPESELVIES
jgi:hypothetical protein